MKLRVHIVRKHYRDFYSDPREYTRQLRVLEKAIGNKPENPALRFLSGYHYGYLGFVKQSIEQLDKAGSDRVAAIEIMRQLREEMTNKLVKPEAPPTEMNSLAAADSGDFRVMDKVKMI